jgi:hypothetical protein
MNIVFSKMTNTETIKLEELTLLGNTSHSFTLLIDKYEKGVRIIPPKSQRLSLTIMTLVIGLFCSGFLYFYFTGNGIKLNSSGITFGVIAVCLLATFGPLFSFLNDLKCLQKTSPFLDCNFEQNTISICGGSFSTSINNIFCLLAFTESRSEDTISELQLIVDSNGERTRYLIDRTTRNTDRKLLEKFGNLTGLQTIVVGKAGFFRQKPFEMTIITHNTRIKESIF